MLGQSLLIFSAGVLAAVPAPPEAPNDAVAGSSQARGDLNTHADRFGYLPGRRSFYGHPRHRHVDGKGGGGSFGRPVYGRSDSSPNKDANHGSAYYGLNFGAPYHGGGYYDGGVYYRERRD